MGSSKKGGLVKEWLLSPRAFFLDRETDDEGALVNHYSHTLFQLSMNGSVMKKNATVLFGYKAHGFFNKNLSLGGKLLLKLGWALQPSIFGQQNCKITIWEEL